MVFFIFVFAAPVFAQQNLFNVPSSDITQKSDIYLQEQLNIGRNDIYSNLTTVYGLGNGLELGINVLGVGTNYQPLHLASNDTDDAAPFFPLVLFNVQKMFDLTDLFHIAIGTQTGTNVQLSPGVSRLANFSYANFFNQKRELRKKVCLERLLRKSGLQRHR